MNVGIVVSSRGSFGGVETLWYEENFLLRNSFVIHHWSYTELQQISSKIHLALFNLYVHVSFIEKRECWNTLSNFLEISSPSNVIVAGDLNIILDPKEKKGRVLGKDPFQAFVESLIQAYDLLDFKPKTGCFTWSNHKVGAANISTCLDRFLAQSFLYGGEVHYIF